MELTTGTYALGPDSGRLLIRTSRTGLGRKAGHDLTIEVTRWSGEAVVDTADPARSSVTLSTPIDSFEVREGTGGVKPLTDSDRADIKNIISEKILRATEHPMITFRSTAVAGTPEAFTVDGELTIMGRTLPVQVRGSATGDRVRGGAIITQSRWRIKPYSAFFGALKLADDVEFEFDLRLPAAGR